MIHRYSSRRSPLKNFLATRLQGARRYDRIAGFFSSSLLEGAGEALEKMAPEDGEACVRVVCNSCLNPLDVQTARAANWGMHREWCASLPAEIGTPMKARLQRLRRSLKIDPSSRWASPEAFHELRKPELQRIKRLSHDFFPKHNPFIRHIVRRARDYLENTVDPQTNEPYLQRIGQLRSEVLIYNMRYRGSVEDRVHQLLSERLANIRNMFGQIPDTLEDVRVAAALRDEEEAKRVIDAVPKRHPFEMRYDRIEKVDWESCIRVLDSASQLEALRKGW